MASSVVDVRSRTFSDAYNWFWKQCPKSSSALTVADEVDLVGDGFGSQGWKRVCSMPSEIHVELLRVGAIPDPYVGFNEHKVQWVGDVEWIYKYSFPFNSSGTYKHGLLTFEGLDTICDVYLNGTKILATNNMFRTYTHRLVLGQNECGLKDDNTLLLHFKSAKALAKAEEEKYGKVRAGSTNLGDPSRVYVRKAQYDWRWDWGPELMTCGPYRPITFTSYNARIAEIKVSPIARILDGGAFTTSLRADVLLDGSWDSSVDSLIVTMTDNGGRIVKTERIGITPWNGESGPGTFQADVVDWNDLQSEGVELWWPVRYGNQTMYNVEVSLVGLNNTVVDRKTKRIGFRTTRLVQEPLSEPDQYGTGSTFLFEINGVRMFMGGSNWVPADNFLTTISEDRYRDWLTLLRDGNQNMVRMWGGGTYEPDIFYDICDELGIVVWQDFLFACGVYPAHDEFVASVKKEAEDNVTRLRHHPSIVCFCGNNEDYQLVLQWGGIGELPARLIYEHVLPEVVTRLTDPEIPYHRGSPYGGKGWDTSDPTIGDVHQWNIWGGKELQYQEYDHMGGRFVSEFGMPGMPSMSTIKYWMQDANKSQFYSQSQLMAQHTKAGSFERRFAIVMNENFRLSSDFETHVFTTQLMQSEAVSFAYRVWQREWRGRGKEYCAGVLVWQMNDCWPVVSWAIADYFLRPKPVYYTIARQLASITIGMFRTVVKNRDNDRPRQFYEFGAIQTAYATLEIWGTNSLLSARSAKLELNFHDLLSSEWVQSEIHDVVLLPNQSTELLKVRVPGPPREGLSACDPLFVASANVVASARLVDAASGQVLARYSDWPEPYRFLQPPYPSLKISTTQENGQTRLILSVEQPTKCVVLSVDDSDAKLRFSDNALDLIPGDDQEVVVTGLKGRKIKVAYFGRERAQDI